MVYGSIGPGGIRPSVVVIFRTQWLTLYLRSFSGATGTEPNFNDAQWNGLQRYALNAGEDKRLTAAEGGTFDGKVRLTARVSPGPGGIVDHVVQRRPAPYGPVPTRSLFE